MNWLTLNAMSKGSSQPQSTQQAGKQQGSLLPHAAATADAAELV
jgi:hypothetical protein